MASNDCILKTIRRLFLHIRSGTLPAVDDLPELSADWTLILEHVTDQELDQALLEYLRGPSPWWPTPGQLIALTPPARLAATLGTPTDGERAFTDFESRLRYLSYQPEDYLLDEEDPERDEAMYEALQTVGLEALRLGPTFEANPVAHNKLRERWIAAYITVRKRQQSNVKTLRAMVDRQNKQAQRLLA